MANEKRTLPGGGESHGPLFYECEWTQAEPNIVIYPDVVWYGGVTAADVDEIIDRHIIGGKPVDRRRAGDSCINRL